MSVVLTLKSAVTKAQTVQKFSAATTVCCCFRHKANQFPPLTAFNLEIITSQYCGSQFGKVLTKPYRGLRCRSISGSSRCESLFGENKMASAPAKCLENLNFINTALKSLPLDSIEKNYVRSVPGAIFSRVKPTPLNNPALVAHSQGALDLIELPLTEITRPEFTEYFSGNKVLPGSETAAHCYCGHQFGNFAGQLGDGCALLLGEIKNSKGERWELQLKGSGTTPYSRHADGRKVLRSSIREFLCSEAMHYLGIPTTRAGTCITSDDTVTRDLLYSGNSIQEKATVISRISPTFLRFGSFEIFKTRDPRTGRSGPSVGRRDILEQLLDYTTANFFPEIHSAHIGDRAKRTAVFFQEVCQRTARLVALWQSVGFCHGVLNTDNMSIIGVTIDYGPFGFMDRYDPEHICNASDDGGRYSYSHQPSVCRWNLSKLAEALHLFLDDEEAERGLDMYDSEFKKVYLTKMRLKLGLARREFPDDGVLVEELLNVMNKTGCDFTNGFQALSSVTFTDLESESVGEQILDECSSPQEIVKSYRPSMHQRQLQMFQALMQTSPEVLTALGVSPDSIAAEISKMQIVERLKNMSGEEKREQDKLAWMSWLKKYRLRLLQEVEGLDSDEQSQVLQERLTAMKQNNPRFILRNHVSQRAIQMAENGDYSEVKAIVEVLKTPYELVSMATSDDTRVTTAKGVHSSCDSDVSPREYETSYFSKPSLSSLGMVVT